MDRSEAIERIRKALKRRSGKTWSVTGGRGTAWGWIHVSAPPARTDRYGARHGDAGELAHEQAGLVETRRHLRAIPAKLRR